ncbi:MAG: hypothetical protein QM714_00450 [Nocardioides sp.]|uniref:hypothetical protein n=1 Tax=Nocardioides sp. TaxID=35761 RepID=UPI0039E62CE8
MAVAEDRHGLAAFVAGLPKAELHVHLAAVDLVRTAEDVRLLTYEVAREMAAE